MPESQLICRIKSGPTKTVSLTGKRPGNCNSQWDRGGEVRELRPENSKVSLRRADASSIARVRDLSVLPSRRRNAASLTLARKRPRPALLPLKKSKLDALLTPSAPISNSPGLHPPPAAR